MYNVIKWVVIIAVIAWLGKLMLAAAGLPTPSYECGGEKITRCKVVLR